LENSHKAICSLRVTTLSLGEMGAGAPARWRSKLNFRRAKG